MTEEDGREQDRLRSLLEWLLQELAKVEFTEFLSGIVEYRVDQEELSEIALENLEVALELPNSYPRARRGLPFILVRLGRDEEAFQEVERQMAERGGGGLPECGDRK